MARTTRTDLSDSLTDGFRQEGILDSNIDFSSLGLPTPSRTYTATSAAETHSGTRFLEISDIDFPHARFLRLGDDLLIVDGDTSVVIASYFSAPLVGLWNARYGFYGAELIASFSEHLPPASSPLDSEPADTSSGEKYALGFLQQFFVGGDGELGSIGVVEGVSGKALVTREGLVIQLGLGDEIFLDDIISTGPDSEIFLRFRDKMEFRLGSEGRLAIDDFVYDEMTFDGTQILSIISGAFSYASGLIAGNDPSSVELRTPYGTIGIRGTKILGKVEPVDSSGSGGLTVTILEGRVALLQDSAEVASVFGLYETLSVTSDAAGGYSYEIGTSSVADILSNYDFLEGSVEQLEEIRDTSVPGTTSKEGTSAVEGVLAIASEDVAVVSVDGELSPPAGSSLSQNELSSAFSAEDSSSVERSTDASLPAVDADTSDDPATAGTSALVGGAGDDDLTGTLGPDRIFGRAGNDKLFGSSGNDELYGETGNDELSGDAGDDLLAGGAGDDQYYFIPTDGFDTIDDLSAINANEVNFVSSANIHYEASHFSADVFSKIGDDLQIDLAVGASQRVTIKNYFQAPNLFDLYFLPDNQGGEGSQVIREAIAVPNYVDGTTGVDRLTGGAGFDIIRGLAGNDELIGGAGSDTLDGGAGEDTASYASAGAGVTANLADLSANKGDALGDSYISIENLRGATNFKNILTGDGVDNRLYGGTKDDDLRGGLGDDDLQGGAGADKYYFSVGDGTDTITDADGGDLFFTSGSSGNYLASNFAPLSFTISGRNLQIDLTVAGVDQRITIVGYLDAPSNSFTLSYNVLAGGAYTSVAIPNYVDGTAGVDRLTGGAGFDIIRGLAGNDELTGGAGGDILDGGADEDTASYAGAGGLVTANLADLSANKGDAAGDSYISIENLRGATNFRNILTGDGGNNKLYGGTEYDELWGGAGNDVLQGGAAGDRIVGGVGNDDLQGGVGTDSYHFYVGDGIDTITDSDGGNLFFESGDKGNYHENDFFFNAFTTSGRNLQIDLTVAGVDQRITIVNYYSDPSNYNIRFNKIAGTTYSTIDIPNFIDGTAGVDTLAGTVVADWIRGFAGVDNLAGNTGNDVLEGGADGDVLDGGSGFDTASYENAGSRVTASLTDSSTNAGDAAGDSYTSIEHLRGATNHHNILTGDGNSNKLYGGQMNDLLYGEAGTDELYGGGGSDALEGGAGADILDGGDSFDTASYLRSGSMVVASLADPSRNTGDAAGDTFISIDALRGASNFKNILTGDDNYNHLIGGGKDDELHGGGGGDYMFGGRGNDDLRGETGVDEYYFYANSDTDTITDTDGGVLHFESKNGIGLYRANDFVTSSFTKAGQNLQINLAVGGFVQQVTIVDYYNNPNSFSIYYDTSADGAEILVPDNIIPS